MDHSPRLFSVQFSDDFTEQLLLTELGYGLYRAEESAIFGEIDSSDTFRAELTSESELTFKEVVDKSPLRNFRWGIPKGVAESPRFRKFLEKVVAAGGSWEQAMGGMLFLHLPAGSGFDPEAEFRLCTSDE